jgi:hypothetical protein
MSEIVLSRLKRESVHITTNSRKADDFLQFRGIVVVLRISRTNMMVFLKLTPHGRNPSIALPCAAERAKRHSFSSSLTYAPTAGRELKRQAPETASVTSPLLTLTLTIIAHRSPPIKASGRRPAFPITPRAASQNQDRILHA